MALKDTFKNFFPIMNPKRGDVGAIMSAGGSKSQHKNLSNKIIPANLERARKDIADWRESIIEAELAWFPYRVKQQKLYEDTVLNEHVGGCMERRKDLTLLRDFQIQNANGEKDKTWTEYFQKTWFKQNFLNYGLDALYYGYNLISIGDIKDSVPVNPSIIRRYNVSPDRQFVSSIQYNPNGWSWNDGPYDDWHIFVKTLSTNGISNCGYGLLYNVAKSEIYLRNNLAFNVDFIEMFAQPYRVLKTSKTEGPERDAAEKALADMGSAGYLLLDIMDELEFMTDGAGGNGYKSYNDIEHRLESKISKYILGHADAIDSVPGKMGSTQISSSGGVNQDQMANTPVAKALRDKQTKDGNFIEPVINEQLIPKLQRLGIGIPHGHKIKFLNDAEERAIQDDKNNTNQKFATFCMTMAQSGTKVSHDYVSEVTGIPVSALSDMPIEAIGGVPNEKKEPSDQIKSKQPLKERSKNRDGKQ